ncbi:MAG: DUF4097 family beta strand repeat-containing protein [Ktedonobacterales bacterium]
MAITKTESHEFRVAGVPRLAIRNFAGNVTLAAGPAGQVLVRVTKRVRGILGTADDADLEKIRVTAEQRDDTITVEAEVRNHAAFMRSVSVDMEITVPAEAALDLRLNAGNTDISGIHGAINAKVNAGNLELRGVTLATGSDLTCNAGNLTFRGSLAPGASFDAAVNAGNMRLHLPRGTGAHLDARTHAGSIDVSGFPVNVTRRFAQQTASGALGAEPHGTITLRVDAGNITLDATE